MQPHSLVGWKEEIMRRRYAAWFTLSFAVFALTAGIAAYAGKPQPPAPPPPFNCRWVVCAQPDCGFNEHLEIPAGACCPVCVPN
jgi:hypothetical protein